MLLLLAMITGKTAAQENNTDQFRETRQWFQEAKFGMFIHWGVYAALGGEYLGKQYGGAEWIQLHAGIPAITYEGIAKTFNPVCFNADRWMKLASQAGMKYVVFTTKHHDGFCMFKSSYTNFNVVDFTPYGKDIVREIAEACKRNNLGLGLYYSLVDWHHPEFPPKYSQMHNFHGQPNPAADMNKYADYQYNQLMELMTGYGPVKFAWFDAGGGFKDADRFKLVKGDSVVKMIRKLQPGCMINSRIGIPGDYGNPEQALPGTIQDQAFEVCMTMNDNWGYSSHDTNWKSADSLIKTLVVVAHKGGNLLLNVGPDGKGNIPQAAVVRLQEIGKWMACNGESIYGTRNSLWDAPSWGYSTTRLLAGGNTILYFMVYHWPKDNRLIIPGLRNNPLQAFVLTPTGRQPLSVSTRHHQTSINLAATNWNKSVTVIGLEITGVPSLSK